MEVPMTPLAERIRPSHLDEIVGQRHLLDRDAAFRRAIESKNFFSMILWGSPGIGKTTLAMLIAKTLGMSYKQISAVSSGIKELREVIQQAACEQLVLFIDEIHHFNKSQQDALLPIIEKGKLILIGATTENPSFEVNAALLSRCQVYYLYPLKIDELLSVVTIACKKDIWLQKQSIEIIETDALLNLSGGDVRKLLNLLELTISIQNQSPKQITNKKVLEIAQKHIAQYDKSGEQHYNIISAFIKSIRGSDPQAAIYWLACMIDAGEEPTFIARRMLILAAEDIGLANPNALLMANTCFDAVAKIGFPEARIILSQCVIYLASSPKSNSAYLAIDKALSMVSKYGPMPVPLHLRNAPHSLMKDMNYGKDYQYSHHYPDHFSLQEYLPDGLQGSLFYMPAQNNRENEIKDFLLKKWNSKYPYL